MARDRQQRQLAAIWSGMVAGPRPRSDRACDASGAHARFGVAVLGPAMARCGGRILHQTAGRTLAVFPSVVDAVTCAVEIQRTALDVLEIRDCVLQVGIDLGEFAGEDDGLHTRAVRVATCLGALAEGGGICVSAGVHEQIAGKLPLVFVDGGEHRVDGSSRPLRIWRWCQNGALIGWTAADRAPAWLGMPRGGAHRLRPGVDICRVEPPEWEPAEEPMAEGRVQRRLAAILSADVVGYSRLMETDETGTLAALKALRRQLIDPTTTAYGGRLVKLMGDGALVEFGSVVDAVACAIDIQEAVATRNAGLPEERRIAFRIGINLGDVMVEDGDLYGDGVNVAARLEQLAEPGGICVSGSVREHVEGKLDARFADAGLQQVKNLARPVHVFRWSPIAEATAALAATSGGRLALPDKPSIAVLPFQNLSQDPEQEHLADGLAEDVISLLSRVRWLFVIARTSTFTYKGRAVDVQRVAEELGVRYVLEGSVRTAGNRIRVTAQLVDARSRAHLWAERYDRELKDIFALQDEITEAIVGALEPELGAAERALARQKPPNSLDTWSCYQRGLWHVYRFREEDTAEALRLFEQAIELDHEFGPAYAGKSSCHFNQVFLSHTERPIDELEEAHRAARRAVALDEKDAFAHWAMARALLLRREHDQAIVELETAIECNPSLAAAHYAMAWVLALAGRSEEALPCIDKAYRLSPHDPLLFAFMGIRAVAHFLAGHYDEAVRWSRMEVRQPNAHFHSHAWLASSLGHLGRGDEAKRALEDTLRLRPDYSRTLVERTVPFKRRSDLEHFLDGLRKAGLPADGEEVGGAGGGRRPG